MLSSGLFVPVHHTDKAYGVFCATKPDRQAFSARELGEEVL